MNDRPLHIVFAGGGTGGHLFPGLAVAGRLVELVPQARITFAGSGKPFERRHVAAAGYDYLALSCRPLALRPREAVAFAFQNLAGYVAAGRFLTQHSAAVVVGLGGYASVPMAQAAGRRRVPLVLVEQNVVPGRATRWLSRRSALICAASAETRANLRCRCPVRVTGTPVRRGFGDGKGPNHLLPPLETCAEPGPGRNVLPLSRDAAQRQLLILGGSGGARSLNENVPKALHKIRQRLSGWQVVHQSGERDFAMTRRLYIKFALPATVVDFIADMPGMLAASELAVCRAGGTTLAELAATGVPAVLLPYGQATDDHQRRNAEAVAGSGAAVLLDERESPGRIDDYLAQTLAPLLAAASRRVRMSAAMRRRARPRAAVDVAMMILELAGVHAGDIALRASA